MGREINKQTKLYVGGADLSGVTNSRSMPIDVDMLNSTTFSTTGGEEYSPGFVKWTFDYAGFVESGDNKNETNEFTNLGSTGPRTITVMPTAGASTGDLAYFMNSKSTQVQIFGEVGQLAPFSVTAQGENVPCNGTVIFTRTGINTSGYGEIYDLGAAQSGEVIRAALQVFDFSGTGYLVSILQANSSSGYSGGNPGTDVIAFTTMSGEGAELKAGAPGSTDRPYYRIEYASSGDPPNISLNIAVAVGYGQN